MDADMANALAQVMGLKSQMKNATFDSIIPGLAAGKFDLGMSSFTVTKEREKTVDFVTYLSAGSSFYVKAQGGPDIQTLDDLCGHSVATERGTIQAQDAATQDKKCKAAGNPGVDSQVYPDQNGANLAISSGRAEVGIADSPVAAYIVEQSNGQFKLSGKSYDSAPYGIAIPKGSGLTDPVAAAMQKVIDDGAYKKILDYWGLDQGAISKVEVNPTNVPAE
jgi:polar amino acid transport system substrate-binding protein